MDNIDYSVDADANLRDEKSIKGEYLYTSANAPKTTMVTIPTATLISQANRQKKKEAHIRSLGIPYPILGH